jgi:hypothetical protein
MTSTLNRDVNKEKFTALQKLSLIIRSPSEKRDIARGDLCLEKQEVLLRSMSYQVREALLENPKLHPKIQNNLFEQFSDEVRGFIDDNKRDRSSMQILLFSISDMQKIAKNTGIVRGLPEKISANAIELDSAVKVAIENSNFFTRGATPVLNHILFELSLVGLNLASNPSANRDLSKAQSGASFSLR